MTRHHRASPLAHGPGKPEGETPPYFFSQIPNDTINAQYLVEVIWLVIDAGQNGELRMQYMGAQKCTSTPKKPKSCNNFACALSEFEYLYGTQPGRPEDDDYVVHL
ncbi:hypothetical protein IAQ61_009643 [Plenodomus lingam]|uniref:uncharacterized protein n=1 Tax=Leptosphaeria maculans TaxID=5022 RepID=UPI003324B034|nr:hypothetical protein IAQ61_009643 [Plenodomus lingam]